MTAKISTGLRNKMLDTAPFRTEMNLSFLDLWSGPVPLTADAALDPSCVKLVRVSNNNTATGLTFEVAAAGGVVLKASAEVWSGLNLASGTPTFFRLVKSGDTGTLSTTESRVQGTVGLAGATMNLSSTSLTSGAPQAIDYFAYALPTL